MNSKNLPKDLKHAGKRLDYSLLEKFTELIDKDPHSAELYNSRAEWYMIAEKYELAIKDLTAAIFYAPDCANYRVNRGASYSHIDRLNEALSEYKIAVELDVNNAMAYNNIGDIYYKLKSYDLALKNFCHAIELDETLVLAYINRAYAYLAVSNLIAAIKDFEFAFSNSEYLPSHLYLSLLDYASILDKDGQSSKAIDVCTLVIENSTHVFAGYRMRARIFKRMRAYSKAIVDLNSALEIEANDSDTFFQLANIYNRLEKKIDAFANYILSISNDLSFTSPYVEVGGLLYSNGLAWQGYSFFLEASILGDKDSVMLINEFEASASRLERQVVPLDTANIVLMGIELSTSYDEIKSLVSYFKILQLPSFLAQLFTSIQGAPQEYQQAIHPKISWLSDVIMELRKSTSK